MLTETELLPQVAPLRIRTFGKDLWYFWEQAFAIGDLSVGGGIWNRRWTRINGDGDGGGVGDMDVLGSGPRSWMTTAIGSHRGSRCGQPGSHRTDCLIEIAQQGPALV